MHFEAECRKPWLKTYAKIKLLSDVTPERVAAHPDAAPFQAIRSM